MNKLSIHADLAVALRSGAPAAAAPASQVTHDGTPCGEAASECSLLMQVLDELDYGVMLVSGNARLKFVNRMGLRHCTAQGCVRLVDGHVRAVDEMKQQALSRACAAALAGRRSMLMFRGQDCAVAAAVLPVKGGGDGAAALIVFERRQVCEELSVEFFAREHRITMAETAVLKALCDGLTPADIALRFGVALSTVRSQIGSMRMKTGVRTIGSLVRMVTVLPPIVAVLNPICTSMAPSGHNRGHLWETA